MAGAGAKRYARAVFELAQASGELDAWRERLVVIGEVFGLPEVRAVLANPSIPQPRRQQAAAELVVDRVGPQGANLARLLVAANRVDEVEAILEEYLRLVDESEGLVQAEVTSAVPLTAEEQEALTRRLAARTGRRVRLAQRVDPTILGGLVVRLGDRILDASLATRLQLLRRRLAEA